MRTPLKFLAGLLLLAVALLGVGVALTWAPDRSVEQLQARWAPPPSQFVEVAGLNVHLRDEGPREDPLPIVLLHGTSASLHTWDGWAEGLKAERRVIRFDLPGFGLTGPFADGDYRVEHYVSFIAALLDRLGVKRVILVGNSFGGELAWETALAFPERVVAQVLIDAAGYPFAAESMPIGFRIARMPLLSPLMQRTLPRSVIESSVRNVYGDPSKVTPALVDRYYELTLRAGNRAALPQRFAQMRPGANADRIPKLTTPTLILWGGQDRLIPPAMGQRFQREIAGSQLIVFDDLGHVPHEEDPQRTLSAARGFLVAADQ
ncbi:alpha/beta hydrolase [Fontimonas sp. SYSU GA230001]|uniref:alpha/beta fold hydrolase n=1 Tax=Fontimonas sp. SYSU GA230001 TaxID=3142450 RepID=UPI0032B47F7A